jgi:hypothetical protein
MLCFLQLSAVASAGLAQPFVLMATHVRLLATSTLSVCKHGYHCSKCELSTFIIHYTFKCSYAQAQDICAVQHKLLYQDETLGFRLARLIRWHHTALRSAP